ncbi:Ca-activated chloride channel family protein [Marinobacter sp. MBR-99]|jgi:Ca-activated chloride channel family protein|uniref:VWA domain-containing protein n=1 Tax=Marinobacter sp. MBR-99 TaxID=3156461 RepID=UPI0033970C94
MADLHLIRPLWLLLALTIPLLYVMRDRLRQGGTGWEHYIPQALLNPLIRRQGQQPGARLLSPLLPLSLGILVVAIALSGPSWRQAPTPLKQPEDSLVIVLDLSLSMLATDVEPDRLTLAKRKIRDILAVRDGGLTGLLVYSGDAHVVTPLTEDRRTIEAMLNVLEPAIMPAQGNRTDLGIKRAVELLEQGAPGRGRILLIADDVPARHHNDIRTHLHGTPYSLNTLAVGSREGGPIPLAKRGFIRDNGNIVITRADPENLARLARENRGLSHELTLGDTDIQQLRLQPVISDDWYQGQDGLTVNRWQDDGYWLLWLALPLLLLGWRKGAFAICAMAILPLTFAPRPVMAFDWGGLWQREDQRGPSLIEQNPARAADLLQQPGWRGSALYRDGKFDDAAQVFADQPGATGHYNRGNALARAGQLEQALEAYQQALDEDPDFEDARANHDLVRQLLEQQQESSSQNGDQNQDNQDQQDSSGDQNQDSQQGDGSESEQNNQGNDPGQSRQPDADQPDDKGQNDGEPDQDTTESAQQAPSDPTEPDAGEQTAEAPAAISEQPLTQGQEQWLRRVPDNPGGLLQRKFLQQHQQRQTTPDEGDTPW